MRILKITLPIPPAGLNLNSRVHWRTRHQTDQAYKQAAYLATLDTINRNPEFRQALPLDRVGLLSTFFFPTNRRRDDDNWGRALKVFRDGIANAGVVLNDSTITTFPPKLDVDRNKPRVELIIREIVPAQAEPERV